MCLYTQEYWRKSFSKIAKNDKNRIIHIFCWPPKFTKKSYLKFFDKNWCKPIQRTEKNWNGYFDNLHQNYDCPKLSRFITSSKMNIFESQKTKKLKIKYVSTNWFQSIFEFGLRNFCSSNRKSHFFQKSEKIKKFKFRGEWRKTISEQSSSTKFLYPLGESMFKKSAKSEMVTGRLVDSYKKPLLTLRQKKTYS
jgi:hypothetical protein